MLLILFVRGVVYILLPLMLLLLLLLSLDLLLPLMLLLLFVRGVVYNDVQARRTNCSLVLRGPFLIYNIATRVRWLATCSLLPC